MRQFTTTHNLPEKAFVVAIIGPSGTGKGTCVSRLLRDPKMEGIFQMSVSATTRKPRAGEKDGVDYYFVDRESFLKKIRVGEFLEYAEVHGNLYGTLWDECERIWGSNKVVLFDIDYRGAMVIKESLGGNMLGIFIASSVKDLESRLRARGGDSEEAIMERLVNAEGEMSHQNEFDLKILNHEGGFEVMYFELRDHITKFLSRKGVVQ